MLKVILNDILQISIYIFHKFTKLNQLLIGDFHYLNKLCLNLFKHLLLWDDHLQANFSIFHIQFLMYLMLFNITSINPEYLQFLLKLK